MIDNLNKEGRLFPKRRKKDDNPYTIGYCEIRNSYILMFKDSLGINQSIHIDDELFELFDLFELEDLSELNRYARHIEHSLLTEKSIHNRALKKPVDLTEEVADKIEIEKIKKELEKLPIKQQRRLSYYYFDELKYQEIAEMEGCSVQSVAKSIDRGLEKIKKIQK